MAEAQEPTQPADRVDFFISHAGVDRRWAEWISWQLEEAGYRVILDAWDFKTGTSFVGAMEDAVSRAERTLVMASPAYFEANYTKPEWEAAFTQDSRGETGRPMPSATVPPANGMRKARLTVCRRSWLPLECALQAHMRIVRCHDHR